MGKPDVRLNRVKGKKSLTEEVSSLFLVLDIIFFFPLSFHTFHAFISFFLLFSVWSNFDNPPPPQGKSE